MRRHLRVLGRSVIQAQAHRHAVLEVSVCIHSSACRASDEDEIDFLMDKSEQYRLERPTRELFGGENVGGKRHIGDKAAHYNTLSFKTPFPFFPASFVHFFFLFSTVSKFQHSPVKFKPSAAYIQNQKTRNTRNKIRINFFHPPLGVMLKIPLACLMSRPCVS